jgi:hypothetical protein
MAVANRLNPIHFIGRFNEDFIPSQMETIFSQAHTPVTAMFIGRLAISALQDEAIAPRTWAEMFWTADQSWAGPVGIVEALWGSWKLKKRLSSTFFLFTLTAVISILTPSAIGRAYPSETVMTQTNTTVPVMVLSESLSYTIARTQLAVGSGAWTTNRTVQQLHGSETYMSMSNSSDGTQDIFFSGDLSNTNGTLPGIRLRGSCTPMEPDATLKEFAERATKKDMFSNSAIMDFGLWCNDHGLDAPGPYWPHLSLDKKHALSWAWCTNYNMTHDWMNKPEGYTNTVITFIDAADTHDSMQGFVNCTSTFSTGRAALVGNSMSKTFEAFQHATFFKTDLKTQHIPFFPPTFAAFSEVSQEFGGSEQDVEQGLSIFRMFGYTLDLENSDGLNETYLHPTLQQASESLWRGVTHMASAVNLVAAQPGTAIALTTRTHAGRERDTVWLIITASLLGSWFILLVYLTARMFRRTFGGSLHSYVAARLLLDMPHLVEGHCAGDMDANPNMAAAFLRVGDDAAGEYVGHIASGGSGILDRRRMYAGRRRS